MTSERNDPAGPVSPAAGPGAAVHADKPQSGVGLPGGSPWRALRRRWLLAVIAGLILGGTAAAGLCILRPAKYTTSALIRVDSERHEILPPVGDHGSNDAELYRLTQTALIKSPKVLDAALRQDKIRQLPIVAAQYDPVTWLENALAVEPIRNTELLRVALSGEDAEEITTLVNAVVQAYLQEVVNRDQRLRFEKLKDIKEVCEKSEDKLRKQRKRLQGVAESVKANDPENAALRQKIALEEYVALRKELITLTSELRQAAKLREADAARSVGIETPGSATALEQALDDNSEVQLQIKKIGQAEETLALMKSTAKPGFRGIADADTALATAKDELKTLRARLRRGMEEKVRQRVEADAQLLAARQNEREALLKEQIDAVRKEVEEKRETADKIGLTAILLETERSEIEQVDKITQSLRAERERLEVEGRSSTQRITLEVEATPPRSRSHKAQILVAGVGGIAGFLAGLLGVTWWEYRGRRIYSGEEVAHGLRLRVLGALPLGGRLSKISSGSGSNPQWTEALNGLRTVILHEAQQHGLKAILITSAGPQEGKSTLAGHLAVSLAAAGRRTLLIDADLRRPALHAAFGCRAAPGLSDLLLSRGDSVEAIQPTSAPGLFLLPAGNSNRAVPDLLAQGRLEAVLQPLRAEFDTILIDTSPLLAVNDALLMSQHVDAVILSVRPNRSQTPLVHEACERLRALDIPVLGTVLNGERAGQRDLLYRYVSRASARAPTITAAFRGHKVLK